MSKIEIVMRRDGACLRPLTDIDFDLLEEVRTKKAVTVTVHQARNPEHHSKLWKIATLVADNDQGFHDAEDAVEWAKLQMPWMWQEHKVLATGQTVIRTKSISYASMDQIRFARFYDRCLHLWSQRQGTDVESYLAEYGQAA